MAHKLVEPDARFFGFRGAVREVAHALPSAIAAAIVVAGIYLGVYQYLSHIDKLAGIN